MLHADSRWRGAQAVRRRAVTRSACAVTRAARARVQSMSIRGIERALGQIHRASSTKRCSEESMQIPHSRRWLPERDGGGQTIEDRSGRRRFVAIESDGDLFGVGKKAVRLVEFVF